MMDRAYGYDYSNTGDIIQSEDDEDYNEMLCGSCILWYYNKFIRTDPETDASDTTTSTTTAAAGESSLGR